MSGYVKRIAAINQIKDGFSTSGEKLSGLIKVEKYGKNFTAECSLINFSPLSEGKYTCAVTDGNIVEIFDCPYIERESDINLSNGFAAVICFVNGGARAIASAVSGGMGYALLALKSAVEIAEQKQPKTAPEQNGADAEYRDEAITEVNYYEFESSENSGANQNIDEEKTHGSGGAQNENVGGAGGEQTEFFTKIEAEINKVLNGYPKEDALCAAVENSDWVRIELAADKFYVFGVIYEDSRARYLCYGVPAEKSEPPECLKGLALYIPADGGGYFVICQNAATGKVVNVK